MINIGLESVIDKAVQGDSVSFKVKLYDENLNPVVAEEDIVVTLSNSLNKLAPTVFVDLPLTVTLLNGESEVLVSLETLSGNVTSLGTVTYQINSLSSVGGFHETLSLDGTIAEMRIAEKSLTISLTSLGEVVEGASTVLTFTVTDLNGIGVELYGSATAHLKYTYPQENAANVAEVYSVAIQPSGIGYLELNTFATAYTGQNKTVNIEVIDVVSLYDTDWIVPSVNSSTTVETICEAIISVEPVNSVVKEGDVLVAKVCLTDKVGSSIVSAENIEVTLVYNYIIGTEIDIVPTYLVVIPAGISEVLLNIPTTNNVYFEDYKVIQVKVDSISGGSDINNLVISSYTLDLGIENEILDYDPTNSVSKDPVVINIEEMVESVPYGNDLPLKVFLVDVNNNAVTSRNYVTIPILKSFYKGENLIEEVVSYVDISIGDSYVETTISGLPNISTEEVNIVKISVIDVTANMSGIEQFEQVLLSTNYAEIVIESPVVEYDPNFTMTGQNIVNGESLTFLITLNPRDVEFLYSLTSAETSTAEFNIDYKNIRCTNGVIYDSAFGMVRIPSGVSEFMFIADSTKNVDVGKANKILTLILDNKVSASVTIDNTIAGVISVGNAQGNEGSTITHEVVFVGIDYETRAVGTLTNINTREGDITSVSIYYVSGYNKIYVPSEVNGNSFYFNVASQTMYVEVGTKSDSIYESDKTYDLTVGIVRESLDLYSKTSVGTIINTTPAPDVTSISSTSVAEGSTAVITVNLSTVSSINTTKPISFGGTAQANIDYNKEFVYSNGVVNSSGMLVIPPYVSSFTISVETYNDDLFKNSIYLDVNVGTKSGKITITNEEDRPTLTITNSQVIEGNYGILTLGVTKASTTDTIVDLEFDVLGQTASITEYVDNIEVLVDGVWVNAVKIGSRYIVTIPALDTDTEIRVLTVSDNIVKGDKTLKIKANIQGVLPAIIGTINIVDKDTAVVDIEDVTVNETEGVVTIPIRMSKANANPVSLNVITEDVTANSNDYAGINTIVTFPAGSTEQFVDIIIRQDSIYEGPETFNVIIESVSNNSVIIGKGVGVVTILDDDLIPNVASMSSTTISEGSTATHIVSLTNASKFPTEVDILLTNHGSNISSVSTIVNGVESAVVNPYITNRITLSPGLVNFSVKVKTDKDGVYRGNTSYNVNANIGGTVVSGVGTVTDENDRPKISISSASAREGDNLVFYVYLDKNTLVDIIMPYRLEHITTSPADVGVESFTRGVLYDVSTGNITVPKGVMAFEVIIPTVSDTDKEILETLRIVIDGTIGIGNISSVIEDEKNENIDGDSNAIVSTNIVEIDTQGFEDIEIRNSNLMVAGMDNNYDVQVENLDELDITVAKKEYTITGDEIYIPQLYDDAPQWMKDLVNLVVDVSMSTNNMTLINDMNKMLQEFAVSYVPLNQYTQSILDLGNEDIRLNALIDTLNSNFNNGLSEANAQIISLQMTKASKDEVIAQVIQTLAAQLADPSSNLGATVGNLDRAIVAEQTARASSFRTLTATLEGIDSNMSANAQAVDNIMAYVGIDEAGASTNTGLSAYLEASDGTIGGADSQLANTIRVTAEGVESKWAYNSIVNINGVYRKSGFGLTANNFSGAGTKANPYTSEFWIDATKLRFTNSNMTGRTAPFTIDASGTTPQIKFNGVVEFSNVANVPQLGSTPQQVVNAINNGNTTVINGARIDTGVIGTGVIYNTGANESSYIMKINLNSGTIHIR